MVRPSSLLLYPFHLIYPFHLLSFTFSPIISLSSYLWSDPRHSFYTLFTFYLLLLLLSFLFPLIYRPMSLLPHIPISPFTFTLLIYCSTVVAHSPSTLFFVIFLLLIHKPPPLLLSDRRHSFTITPVFPFFSIMFIHFFLLSLGTLLPSFDARRPLCTPPLTRGRPALNQTTRPTHSSITCSSFHSNFFSPPILRPEGTLSSMWFTRGSIPISSPSIRPFISIPSIHYPFSPSLVPLGVPSSFSFLGRLGAPLIPYVNHSYSLCQPFFYLCQSFLFSMPTIPLPMPIIPILYANYSFTYANHSYPLCQLFLYLCQLFLFSMPIM
ncbi:uncharacterized protein EDB91DRAFT_374114 [Suillus paluster]|uniref:uncharacterized protein n=1 Tax=Suillus paluster TaxID=48578 RepID=UPI001B8829A6|nr:uncharacterized protein EDB91DRAFT_374114 [Suillus paluster]KAG1739929.1 hypothetical protein EDB91DRAFT_374114 [Suillus paluster]